MENTTKTPAQYLSYGKIWHQDLALEEPHLSFIPKEPEHSLGNTRLQ